MLNPKASADVVSVVMEYDLALRHRGGCGECQQERSDEKYYDPFMFCFKADFLSEQSCRRGLVCLRQVNRSFHCVLLCDTWQKITTE